MSENVDQENKVESIELEELSKIQNLSGESLVERSVDLVGHINVNLHVQVGTITVPISEFFSLQQGSVVALNEELSEPVSLVLDSKIIAKGELVAVGDMFGFKVKAIL